ncbi:SAM-dependent chlorinase/fluorinase, partial [Exiguobacterium sp.]
MAEALVLQSDFGVSDGAVSAMYGVAHSINPEIRIFDLTHDIPPFHIWEASYRLLQTVPYWTIANAQEARGIAVSHGSL